MSVPRVLIIAGSDSGGGAGIQADIKTVTMLGGHAMTAVTAITAQNTLGVIDVHPIPVATVIAQVDAVVSDIGVDAVKIGMIGSAETAHAVADRLQRLDVPIVFDPVMVATSGSVLADQATIGAFERLMALAAVITPNAPELDALGGDARSLAARTGSAVLAKGGDRPGAEVEDLLVLADGTETRWTAPRIDTRHTHGTGCTLASAVATELARGRSLAAATALARDVVRQALRAAPGLGGGHGPMGHWAVTGGSTNLNQVTLPARDYEEAVRFYRQLGLRQIVDSSANGYARFECEGGATLSVHVEAEPRIGGAVIYLESTVLDSWLAELHRIGVASDPRPREERWGWREARLTDPTGNNLCLYHAGAMRRFPPWRLSTAE